MSTPIGTTALSYLLGCPEENVAADTPKESKDQGILCDDPEKEQVSNDGT